MLPMNAMAQKVVPGSESGSMKPLTGSGLSYVTLQPPSQPLSLVQDHRPSVYQTPPYIGSNMEKEPETEKLIPNGVEITTKTETEQDVPAVVKQSETNRNNNLSPENPAPEQPCEMQPEQELTSLTLDFPALCTPAQTKVEEKKTPVNNGSKESDGKAINTSVHIKQSPHKPEDAPTKNEIPKVKPTNQSSKVPSESVAAALTTTYKPDAKITTSPKTTKRKSRELKDLKAGSSGSADGASKPKRNRIQTQPYQSPLPEREIALLVKSFKTPPSKTADDKLIVFYKNEFLAVRNAEGSFYVCQAMQNIYKSSRRIRIRWLSQDKTNGEFYSPDFYDTIEFDCILTNLNLSKVDKHKFCLTRIELLRTENILKRAIDVEAGVSEKPRVTEEHPDGLDLSLYKDESQLKRRKGLHEKQSQRKKSKRAASSTDDEADEEESEKKTSKMSRAKKRSVNKALAIAKSVAKGTSRAERALNRSTKSGNSLGNDVATSAATTAAAATITTNATVTAVATTTVAAATATAVNLATNTTADAKNNAETKKLDLKKNGKQPNSNSVRGFPRTKLGGSAQATQASKTTGRPKRVAATTGVVLSTEETPSPRKKPRGRT
ncbi:uncharacterized protein LOC105274707 isoform X1 [Ooceraea biroi]|uniref:Uncharacterized protein n=2 Tax=Ooceraea biroi TaxID=2015173 RepID=A0A026WYF2_OOCBI|nr:uncharacterized protein LOC105274707 isoform X1 [Ooceraea biroi]EZA60134.1 hypothetical protein X777_15071 [Ooceraea biroi]